MTTEHNAHELRLLTNPATWLCAAVGALAITTAHAATTPDDLTVPANADSMTAKQAYQHDKAYCNSGETTEARATCLKEAARAYQENKAGVLEAHASSHSHRTHMARRHTQQGTANASGTGSSSRDADHDNDHDQDDSSSK